MKYNHNWFQFTVAYSAYNCNVLCEAVKESLRKWWSVGAQEEKSFLQQKCLYVLVQLRLCMPDILYVLRKIWLLDALRKEPLDVNGSAICGFWTEWNIAVTASVVSRHMSSRYLRNFPRIYSGSLYTLSQFLDFFFF